MLKAKKKITKKEIKHDPFLESIYQAKEYFEENKQLITQRGLFILARLYYEQKDYLTAESNLQDFLDDPTEEFHAGALMMMADIEKINGYTESIADHIKQAIQYALNEPEKDKYSMVLAEHYINIRNYKDALELAESIHEKYDKRSDLHSRAQEILGRLHTVVSDEQ